MAKQRTLLMLLAMIVLTSSSLLGQDKQLKKANNLYKALKYSSAIPIYEAYLQENKKTNLSVKAKLANCYRMTSKPDKAEKIYQKIVAHPKARPINFYYYGEILMAKGNYADAKKWFLKYDNVAENDERGGLMAEACDKVKLIQPLYPDAAVEFLTVNTVGDDFSPMFYKGDLLFVTDYSPKALSKTYAFTGRSFLKLMKSAKTGENQYGELENISKRINVPNKNSGPSATDGKNIYFTRNSDVLSKRQRYNMQIYQINLEDKSGITSIFERGVLMNFCNENHNYMHPTISSTGDTIYYVSDKPGGFGGTDIYFSHKKGEEWTRPENIGGEVNTPENEGFPHIGKDGKLYFSTKGHPGFGGFDIFVAERNGEGEFAKITNLGIPINSPKDDTGFLLTSDDAGYFASSRREGNDDIYAFKHFKIALQVEVVSDQAHDLIKGATVTIKTEDNKWTALTDKKGRLTNNLALNKTYTVTVTRDGFKDFTQTVSTKNLRKSTTIKVLAPLKLKVETSSTEKAVRNEDGKSEPTGLFLIGKVIDKTTKKPIEDCQIILENKISKQKKSITPNLKGVLNDVLIPNADYILYGQKEGYYLHKSTFNTKEKGVLGLDTIFYTIEVEKIQTNQPIILKDVSFEKGQTVLNSYESETLDNLVKMLMSNTSLEIEIGVHTDSRGNATKNLDLSKKRAEAVVDYLIFQGIDMERLTAKGYGETKPLNKCKDDVDCSEKEHDLNNRVEMIILKG